MSPSLEKRWGKKNWGQRAGMGGKKYGVKSIKTRVKVIKRQEKVKKREIIIGQ
jgi:hypothetical protein